MKRIPCVFWLFVILCMVLEGCAYNGNPPTTIGDIAFDSRYRGEHIVYIQEDSEYVPYIVVTNDYQGDCLLLRESIMPTPRRVNDYESYYENSEIDWYLNNEFLPTLGTLSDEIVQSNITITDKSSLGCSGDTTKKISRKIFLLSLTEIDIDDSLNTGIEGRPLKYFENPENRIAYRDNEAASWWLRTPNTYYDSCVYSVGGNNKIGYTNAFDENGVRPAFCVKAETEIIYKDGAFYLAKQSSSHP